MTLSGAVIDREAYDALRKRALKKEDLNLSMMLLAGEIKSSEQRIKKLNDECLRLCNEYKAGRLSADYNLERMLKKLRKDASKETKKRDKLKAKLHKVVSEHNDLEVELLKIKTVARKAV